MSLDLLRECDMFFPNEREGERMTGESEPKAMLRWWRDRDVPGVALKLGDMGAMLLCHGKLYRQPPYRVKPVDTTGAGDCFDAGYIHGWLNGHTPLDCLRIAAICGAMSTRGLGGIATFPTMEELEEALEKISS